MEVFIIKLQLPNYFIGFEVDYLALAYATNVNI